MYVVHIVFYPKYLSLVIKYPNGVLKSKITALECYFLTPIFFFFVEYLRVYAYILTFRSYIM